MGPPWGSGRRTIFWSWKSSGRRGWFAGLLAAFDEELGGVALDAADADFRNFEERLGLGLLLLCVFGGFVGFLGGFLCFGVGAGLFADFGAHGFGGQEDADVFYVDDGDDDGVIGADASVDVEAHLADDDPGLGGVFF